MPDILPIISSPEMWVQTIVGCIVSSIFAGIAWMTRCYFPHIRSFAESRIAPLTDVLAVGCSLLIILATLTVAVWLTDDQMQEMWTALGWNGSALIPLGRRYYFAFPIVVACFAPCICIALGRTVFPSLRAYSVLHFIALVAISLPALIGLSHLSSDALITGWPIVVVQLSRPAMMVGVVPMIGLTLALFGRMLLGM